MNPIVRRLLGAFLVSALGVATAGATSEALRVCADPDNLPFSAASGPVRGLYVDVAELVAARLGTHTEYTWWHTAYGQRAVRNTLLADRCDVFFGLPDDPGFMGRQLDRTTPFLDIGYAAVVPTSRAVRSLEDLKDLVIAVQFRSQPMEHGEAKGCQADIGPGWWGKLYEENGRALLWERSGEQHVKPGEWNDYEIVASGSKIKTFINGQPCVDLDDPSGAKRGR